MDPLTQAMLISLAPSLFKGGEALWQGAKANQFARHPRPTYNIPTPITDNYNLAKSALGQASQYGLPGQGRIENKMAASGAGALNTLQNSQYSPAAIAAGAAAVDANTKNSIADLGVKADTYRANNMREARSEVYNTGKMLSGYQDKQWDWNSKSPYLQAMMTASALRNASKMNANSAITGAADSLSNYAIRGGFNDGQGAVDANGNPITSLGGNDLSGLTPQQIAAIKQIMGLNGIK